MRQRTSPEYESAGLGRTVVECDGAMLRLRRLGGACLNKAEVMLVSTSLWGARLSEAFAVIGSRLDEALRSFRQLLRSSYVGFVR